MVKSHCCCCQQKCAKASRIPQEGHSCPDPWLQGVSEAGAAPEDSAKGTWMWCEQVSELLWLLAGLKQEVKRLRSIRESKREIDWWSYSLASLGEAWQESEGPSPSYHQAEGDLADGRKGNGYLLKEVAKFHADLHHLPRCPYRIGMRPWVQRLRQMMVNKKICLESVQVCFIFQTDHNHRKQRIKEG